MFFEEEFDGRYSEEKIEGREKERKMRETGCSDVTSLTLWFLFSSFFLSFSSSLGRRRKRREEEKSRITYRRRRGRPKRRVTLKICPPTVNPFDDEESDTSR